MTDKEIEAIVYGYNRPLEYYAIEFQMYMNMMTEFLHYLLRNYEIVSKEKVNEEYNKVKTFISKYDPKKDNDLALGGNTAKHLLLRELFPQLMKSEEK